MSKSFSPADATASTASSEDWKKKVAPFRTSDTGRSVFQVVTTWAAFFGAWAVAWWGLSVHWAITVAADLVLAGVIVRLFVIQHDCGHGSFFASDRANRFVGSLSSVLLFTPYAAWARDHAIHHATTGDLERRGVGDIAVWTTDEYAAAGKWARLGYRLMRNPFVMFLGGPFAVFGFGHRVPKFFAEGISEKDARAVHITTLASVSMAICIFAVFGWQGVLLIQLPASILAAGSGIFLFYVQHQIEQPHWARGKEWSYVDACLLGSSHLKLNPLLRWFSGDIGVHHLHHLAPKIPNYKLRACLKANPELEARTTLTLGSAFKTIQLKLYDENTQRMVGFETEQSGSEPVPSSA